MGKWISRKPLAFSLKAGGFICVFIPKLQLLSRLLHNSRKRTCLKSFLKYFQIKVTTTYNRNFVYHRDIAAGASVVSLYLNGGIDPRVRSDEVKDPNLASTDHNVEERAHLEKCQCRWCQSLRRIWVKMCQRDIVWKRRGIKFSFSVRCLLKRKKWHS